MTMPTLLYLYPLAGALMWRLGGGDFTTLTGLNFGTDPAPLLRGALAGVLAIKFGWQVGLAAIGALFLGVCIGGWGPFQGMGLPAPYSPEASRLRWLPERMGFAVGTVAHDFIGMAEAGALCMTPLAALLAWRADWAAVAILFGGGLLCAPSYLLARTIPWYVPKFAQGQAWGEVFAGAVVGAALLGVST